MKTTRLSAFVLRHHFSLLMLLAAVAVIHWGEHIAQAVQFWALHMPLRCSDAMRCAGGLLGFLFPKLVANESLHFGFALVMWLGLGLLRRGVEVVSRRAGSWWFAAFAIQTWHLFEHSLLFIQAQTHQYFFGGHVPMSFGQLLMPRIVLHLFYNTVVTIPMAVGMILYMRQRKNVVFLDAKPKPKPARMVPVWD